MGEVAGADHGDAFARRPPGQRPGVAVLAAGAREAGVDVKVRVKHAARNTVTRGRHRGWDSRRGRRFCPGAVAQGSAGWLGTGDGSPGHARDARDGWSWSGTLRPLPPWATAPASAQALRQVPP